ncbi:MAG: phosphopantothenoylcysteine decarboxylase [Sedimentisphaerales bacterium]|nr:phosphopantothenoylcysteine decarboxylase [Sedimentisphaerales bacterium]
MAKNKRFLITAGGTREYIDPVRFISNASSGKMGYALAAAAIAVGHSVTLITAPTNLEPPKGAKVVEVETSEQMLAAVKKYFSKCDCLIMAAAVSDYAPIKTSKTKIKKNDRALTIKLKPTTDILKWAGQHKKQQIVVGFALEDKDLKERAAKKLTQKNLDMIIANTPAAIGAEKSSVHIFTSNGQWTKLPLSNKALLAKKIVGMVAHVWHSRPRL